MTIEAFDQPQKVINWAIECLKRGQESFVSYVQDDSFAFVIEDDLETGDKLKKFKQIKPIPDSIEGNFRNAIVDLKHSFDMSLFAAAKTLGFSQWDGNYPWSDSQAGLKIILGKRQKKLKTQLPQVLIDEIERHQPYATRPGLVGGNDLIREVAKMANDKHTVGLRATAAISSVGVEVFVLRAPANGTAGAFYPWDPVKKEMVVFRMSGDGGSISHSNPTMELDVLFEFAGMVGKIPAQAIIMEFAKTAQLVLEGFKRVCREAIA